MLPDSFPYGLPYDWGSFMTPVNQEGSNLLMVPNPLQWKSVCYIMCCQATYICIKKHQVRWGGHT